MVGSERRMPGLTAAISMRLEPLASSHAGGAQRESWGSNALRLSMYMPLCVSNPHMRPPPLPSPLLYLRDFGYGCVCDHARGVGIMYAIYDQVPIHLVCYFEEKTSTRPLRKSVTKKASVQGDAHIPVTPI